MHASGGRQRPGLAQVAASAIAPMHATQLRLINVGLSAPLANRKTSLVVTAVERADTPPKRDVEP